MNITKEEKILIRAITWIGEDANDGIEEAQEIMNGLKEIVKLFSISGVGDNEAPSCDNPNCDEGIVDRDYYGHPIFCHCCEQGDR